MDIIDGYIMPGSWERLALDLRERQRTQLRELNLLLEAQHAERRRSQTESPNFEEEK